MRPLTISLLTAAIFLYVGCGNNGASESSVNSSSSSSESSAQSSSSSSYPAENVDYSVEYSERMYYTRTSPSDFDIGSSQTERYNLEALVTAMCYTRHDQQYNPCYVCHQNEKSDGRANKMHDGFLQNEYAFSVFGGDNHWTNLLLDRSEQVAQISDAAIDTYVNTENYSSLAPMLKSHTFTGYVPDLENYQLGAEAFGSDGFAKDGSGWVAFNYKPLPSTFWPVNGSTDDVLIRLYKDFRNNADGNYSKTVYQFNLAIVEAAIKNLETVSVPDLDENSVGVDLNGDGILGVVNEIKRPGYYVGAASYVPVETFLYPRYTEFLHSVRYVGSDTEGNIYNAPRMKELRYMIKERSYYGEDLPFDKPALAKLYDDEYQEKIEQNNAPKFPGLGERGINDKFGWWLQGFIEDADGELRPQNYEETLFCMGCHTTLGSTIDQAFAFARKIDGTEGWGYIDLKSMVDVPNVGEDKGEILTYMQRVGGASEFRAHNSIRERYFDNDEVNESKVLSAQNVYELITPTREEALYMSKAYKVLVESQDFIHGREGNGKPVENVHRSIDDTTPTLPKEKQYEWDMRLDWTQQQ